MLTFRATHEIETGGRVVPVMRVGRGVGVDAVGKRWNLFVSKGQSDYVVTRIENAGTAEDAKQLERAESPGVALVRDWLRRNPEKPGTRWKLMLPNGEWHPFEWKSFEYLKSDPIGKVDGYVPVRVVDERAIGEGMRFANDCIVFRDGCCSITFANMEQAFEFISREAARSGCPKRDFYVVQSPRVEAKDTAEHADCVPSYAETPLDSRLKPNWEASFGHPGMVCSVADFGNLRESQRIGDACGNDGDNESSLALAKHIACLHNGGTAPHLEDRKLVPAAMTCEWSVEETTAAPGWRLMEDRGGTEIFGFRKSLPEQMAGQLAAELAERHNEWLAGERRLQAKVDVPAAEPVAATDVVAASLSHERRALAARWEVGGDLCGCVWWQDGVAVREAICVFDQPNSKRSQDLARYVAWLHNRSVFTGEKAFHFGVGIGWTELDLPWYLGTGEHSSSICCGGIPICRVPKFHIYSVRNWYAKRIVDLHNAYLAEREAAAEPELKPVFTGVDHAAGESFSAAMDDIRAGDGMDFDEDCEPSDDDQWVNELHAETVDNWLQRLRDAVRGERGPDQQRIAETVLRWADLLLRKNADYGAAVWRVPLLTPDVSAGDAILVRMSDKISRLKTLLANGGEGEVYDETIEDNVGDLGAYCLLWLARPADCEGDL